MVSYNTLQNEWCCCFSQVLIPDFPGRAQCLVGVKLYYSMQWAKINHLFPSFSTNTYPCSGHDWLLCLMMVWEGMWCSPSLVSTTLKGTFWLWEFPLNDYRGQSFCQPSVDWIFHIGLAKSQLQRAPSHTCARKVFKNDNQVIVNSFTSPIFILLLSTKLKFQMNI